jgi:hypothetical protein
MLIDRRLNLSRPKKFFAQGLLWVVLNPVGWIPQGAVADESVHHPRLGSKNDAALINSSRAFHRGFVETSGAANLGKAVGALKRVWRNGVGREGREASRLQRDAEEKLSRTHDLTHARGAALSMARSQAAAGRTDAAARGLYHAEKAHQALGPAVEESITTLGNLHSSQFVGASKDMTKSQSASKNYPDLVAAAARVGGASDQKVAKPSVYSGWVGTHAGAEESKISLAHGAGRAVGAATKAAVSTGAAAGLGVATGGIGPAAVVGIAFTAGAGAAVAGNEVAAGVKMSQTHADSSLSSAQRSEALGAAKLTRARVNTAVEVISAPVVIGLVGVGALDSMSTLSSSATSLGEAAAHGTSAALGLKDAHGSLESLGGLVSSPSSSGGSSPLSGRSARSSFGIGSGSAGGSSGGATPASSPNTPGLSPKP